MLPRKQSFYSTVFIILLTFVVSGCSVTFQTGRRSDMEKIESLSNEIDALTAKWELLKRKKDDEIVGLEGTRKLLEKRLAKEIGEKGVRLEMVERGLAIIFLAEVLFDSGKTEIKQEAFSVLAKLAKVLKENIGDRSIGIEGHTDNEPIKYSGWKSNWELSTARATSVLHYIVDEKGVNPKRVSATGYGEHRPDVSNDTVEGRRQNRRVEVVVLPRNMGKIQQDMDKIAEQKRKIQKRLRKYKK